MADKKIALALGSGILLSLSFPLFDLWPLAWVSFVPLFWLTERAKGKKAFLFGWAHGAGFYLASLYWIAPTVSNYSNVPLPLSIFICILLGCVLGLYTGAFASVVSLLRRRGISLLLSAAPAWVGLEWLRSFFLIGFPWASLGYSQYLNRSLIQFSEVTGVYGVSAVIVFANAVVFALARAWREKTRAPYGAVFLLAGVVFGLCLWGNARARRVSGPEGHWETVGVVQGNIAQDQKWDPAFQSETLGRYLALTEKAVRNGARLVVWPETAVPFFFQSDPRRGEMIRIARENGVPLLFGSPAFRENGGVLHLLNRAYLISPEGNVTGFYDKVVLVPFGEYVPFQRLIPFVRKLVVGIGDFQAGSDAVVLPVGASARVGVLICYEGIFPELSREFVRRGADILVNITNDAWFGRTSAPAQHLSMLTFRAIENRVSIVRAANTGFSGFIGRDGRILERTELFTEAVRTASINWTRWKTLYTEWGDLFAQVCFGLTVLLLGYAAVFRRRKHERNAG